MPPSATHAPSHVHPPTTHVPRHAHTPDHAHPQTTPLTTHAPPNHAYPLDPACSHVNRMTDACKSISFPQLRWRAVKVSFPCGCCVLWCSYFILFHQVIWFSSGGTNSYVHTDQVDNLHCVFSGNKYFIMVHPKYLEKVNTTGIF